MVMFPDKKVTRTMYWIRESDQEIRNLLQEQKVAEGEILKRVWELEAKHKHPDPVKVVKKVLQEIEDKGKCKAYINFIKETLS